MPAEFKDTKALVYCNDCGAKSVVKYHWLGLKCDMWVVSRYLFVIELTRPQV
jgi:hypothetical protein